jgi:hypothetical protein
MILKKVGQALRNQDWTAVTIELLILIVGIYVGLQADEWRVDGEKRADVERQLDRILSDARFVEQSIDDLLLESNDDLARFHFAEQMLTGTVVDQLSDQERFALAVADSFRMNEVDVVIPELEHLIESGEIRVIRNDKLEAALLDFINYHRRQGSVVEHVRHLVRSQAEVIMASTTYSITELHESTPAGAETRLEYDLDELRNNTQFRRAMGNLMILNLYLRLRWVGYGERISKMIEALELRHDKT